MEKIINSELSAKENRDTIALMVSVGNRTHLSDYTYPRLAAWAALHGYSSMLVKKGLVEPGTAPHFNKLIPTGWHPVLNVIL